MGGAGKTPTVIALAKYLQNKGLSPHILSRGYKAHVSGPTLVDLAHHSAHEVGDEPLLLSRTAPTWVYKDRVASAHAAIEAGADILIMDDGFQNPSLYKDMSLVVVDGKQGFGNGRVFPAGPLREYPSRGLARADAVVLLGKDEHGFSFPKPVLKGQLKAVNPKAGRVLAFTGLGFPEKFYQTLRDQGYEIVDTESFPDHHPYTNVEILQLIESARGHTARLITTEKDMVRIPLELRSQIETLDIWLEFEHINLLDDLLRKFNS